MSRLALAVVMGISLIQGPALCKDAKAPDAAKPAEKKADDPKKKTDAQTGKKDDSTGNKGDTSKKGTDGQSGESKIGKDPELLKVLDPKDPKAAQRLEALGVTSEQLQDRLSSKEGLKVPGGSIRSLGDPSGKLAGTVILHGKEGGEGLGEEESRELGERLGKDRRLLVFSAEDPGGRAFSPKEMFQSVRDINAAGGDAKAPVRFVGGHKDARAMSKYLGSNEGRRLGMNVGFSDLGQRPSRDDYSSAFRSLIPDASKLTRHRYGAAKLAGFGGSAMLEDARRGLRDSHEEPSGDASVVDARGSGRRRQSRAAVPGKAGAGAGLDHPEKKEIAMRLVSAAENSSLDWKEQYKYIEYNVEGNKEENRGYTGGTQGFTSATGDMLSVVRRYSELAPGNPLEKYIAALEKVNGTPSRKGLGRNFERDWAAADKDSRFRQGFRQAQDQERDETYFKPAVDLAKKDGLRALGQFAYYDAAVMHGTKEGEGGLSDIRAAAMKKAVPPSQGGDEAAYLSAFLDARKQEMLTEQGHQETSRVDTVQRAFLKAGNFDLKLPLKFSVYGTPYTIDSKSLAGSSE